MDKTKQQWQNFKIHLVIANCVIAADRNNHITDNSNTVYIIFSVISSKCNQNSLIVSTSVTLQ